MRKNLFISLAMVGFFVVMASLAMTTDKIGEVNALKGKASIMRADKELNAGVKDSLLLTDIVETAQSSRMKMLFIDDSILNLGENTKVSIQDYVIGDEKKRGQSLFSLLDGRVRAVVGKNKLEIHTPTAVAAARGTILILWMQGTAVSPETCLALIKGTADASNINKEVKGTESVTEGNMTCVAKDMPPTKQKPIPPALRKKLNDSTDADPEPDTDDPKGGDRNGDDNGVPGTPEIELEPKEPCPSYGY